MPRFFPRVGYIALNAETICDVSLLFRGVLTSDRLLQFLRITAHLTQTILRVHRAVADVYRNDAGKQQHML